MPSVKPGESKKNYLQRCIPQVMKEGGTQEQAIGKCYGMWSESKDKATASIQIDKDDEVLIFAQDKFGGKPRSELKDSQ